MNYNFKKLEKIKVKDFSLKITLESGQFFYFKRINDFYYIIENDKIFKIKQKGDYLIYSGINIDNKYIINFFGLNCELNKITEDFDNDEYLSKAKKQFWGLRSQNTEFWQCAISFLCSSASSIEKIKKNIFLISKEFGKEIIFDNKTFYLFPNIGDINDKKRLLKCKVGFRSKYILEFNNSLKNNPNLIKEITNEINTYFDNKKKLMKFKGIGPKVADCICLFSLNNYEAFPIDTWIKQIIEKLYLKRKSKNINEIEEFIRNYFKKNLGIKQQYLFHWARNSEIREIKN